MGQFQRWVLDQLHSSNVSAREASLAAGLSHGAISRYLSGSRPSAAACKKLADYFEVPAELRRVYATIIRRVTLYKPKALVIDWL